MNRSIGGDCNSKLFSSKVSLGKGQLNASLRNRGGQSPQPHESPVQQHGVGSLGGWNKVCLGAVGLEGFGKEFSFYCG